MFSDPSPSFGCGTVCSFFHWSHCESSHGFQRKYSIQTTFPMRVLCLTRWFLNSCNPGSLWHSHMTFHYLRIWLFPDKPISVWMFILPAHHSVWTEWETASSYNTLKVVSYSPGWNGVACPCKWGAKGGTPQGCRLCPRCHLLRLWVSPALRKSNSPWAAAGPRPAVKMGSVKVHLLVSSTGLALPQEMQRSP